MKKRIVLLTCISLLCLSLTACGSSKADQKLITWAQNTVSAEMGLSQAAIYAAADQWTIDQDQENKLTYTITGNVAYNDLHGAQTKKDFSIKATFNEDYSDSQLITLKFGTYEFAYEESTTAGTPYLFGPAVDNPALKKLAQGIIAVTSGQGALLEISEEDSAWEFKTSKLSANRHIFETSINTADAAGKIVTKNVIGSIEFNETADHYFYNYLRIGTNFNYGSTENADQEYNALGEKTPVAAVTTDKDNPTEPADDPEKESNDNNGVSFEELFNQVNSTLQSGYGEYSPSASYSGHSVYITLTAPNGTGLYLQYAYSAPDPNWESGKSSITSSSQECYNAFVGNGYDDTQVYVTLLSDSDGSTLLQACNGSLTYDAMSE